MTARNLKNYIFMAHTCFKRTQRVPLRGSPLRECVSGVSLLGSPLREFASEGSTTGVSFKGVCFRRFHYFQKVPLLGSPLRKFASEGSAIGVSQEFASEGSTIHALISCTLITQLAMGMSCISEVVSLVHRLPCYALLCFGKATWDDCFDYR